MVSEKALENYLARRTRELGGWALKLYPWSIVGLPDRLVLYQGRVRFVELKVPRGQVSKVQRHVHRRLERHGFPVAVVRTTEQVETILRKLTNEETAEN